MMRVTPKISDMPTETRNRNIPTLNPLITWTTMSGPLVIHGRRLVIISTVGLGVGGGTGVLRRPARPHEGYLFLVAASRSCATSSQLLTRSLPWDSSMSATIGLPSSPIITTPAHCGAIACWSQPRMITVPHGNSISNPSRSTAMTLSGSVTLRALDGLRDDVHAGVAPRGPQLRLRVLHPVGTRPFDVLLIPAVEFGMSLQHPVVVPRERGGDGADGCFLAERVQLVGSADGGRDEADLVHEPEGPGLLHEGDLLRPPQSAEKRFCTRLEQCRDIGAVVGLAELRPVLLDHLHIGFEVLQVRPELLPEVLTVLVVGGDLRPLRVRKRRRLLRDYARVLVHVVGGVRDVPVPLIPGQP